MFSVSSEFHIYPIKKIDEGIEVLTGVSADTINKLVQDKLTEMAKKVRGWSETN